MDAVLVGVVEQEEEIIINYHHNYHRNHNNHPNYLPFYVALTGGRYVMIRQLHY
jgi:hypothetical protein